MTTSTTSARPRRSATARSTIASTGDAAGPQRDDQAAGSPPASSAAAIAVAGDAGALTAIERTTLIEYEGVVKQGLETFYAVGSALAAIRDGRLYRETHATFEAYCQDRWQMHRSQAYRLITSAEVVTNLSPIGDIPAPANEAQARELAPLPPEQQREAWQRAVTTAPGGRVTAKHVADVVAELSLPPDYESIRDRLAAHGVTLSRNPAGHYITRRWDRPVGIESSNWENVRAQADHLDNQRAAVGTQPSENRPSAAAEEPSEAAITAVRRRVEGIGWGQFYRHDLGWIATLDAPDRKQKKVFRLWAEVEPWLQGEESRRRMMLDHHHKTLIRTSELTITLRPSTANAEPREVQSVAWNEYLALHPSAWPDDPAPWSLTHRPTGCRVSTFATEEQGRRALWDVADLDWDFTSFDQIPGATRERARLLRETYEGRPQPSAPLPPAGRQQLAIARTHIDIAARSNYPTQIAQNLRDARGLLSQLGNDLADERAELEREIRRIEEAAAAAASLDAAAAAPGDDAAAPELSRQAALDRVSALVEDLFNYLMDIDAVELLRVLALSICARDQRAHIAAMPLRELEHLICGRIIAGALSGDIGPLVALLGAEG